MVTPPRLRFDDRGVAVPAGESSPVQPGWQLPSPSPGSARASGTMPAALGPSPQRRRHGRRRSTSLDSRVAGGRRPVHGALRGHPRGFSGRSRRRRPVPPRERARARRRRPGSLAAVIAAAVIGVVAGPGLDRVGLVPDVPALLRQVATGLDGQQPSGWRSRSHQDVGHSAGVAPWRGARPAEWGGWGSSRGERRWPHDLEQSSGPMPRDVRVGRRTYLQPAPAAQNPSSFRPRCVTR